MRKPKVTIIPMGLTTITNPNKAFSIAMMGNKISREAEAAKQKHLPSKRVK
jgi:hypothetical protein